MAVLPVNTRVLVENVDSWSEKKEFSIRKFSESPVGQESTTRVSSVCMVSPRITALCG